METKPFIRWAGGKSRLLHELRFLVPPAFNTYVEAFTGGGAMYFDMALQGHPVILVDSNVELMSTYLCIQTDVDALIELLKTYPYDETFYYLKRAEDPAKLSLVEVAARFIYLNKTGFNGVYRVNRAGKYNVPFGRVARPNICDEPVLRAASAKLRSDAVVLEAKSAFDIEPFLKAGDFVYFDPPYVPVTATSNFTSYQAGGFGAVEQEKLAAMFDRLDELGVWVLLSNSDVPWVRERYQDHRIVSVTVGRSINSNTSKRSAVSETIVVGRALNTALGGMNMVRKKKTAAATLEGVVNEPKTAAEAPADTTAAPQTSEAPASAAPLGTLAGTPLTPLFGAPTPPPTTAPHVPAVVTYDPLPAFNHIKTNVKGQADVALGPCTAIVGQNRAGKTSILDAVRLGISGKHPVGQHAVDLMELAPHGASGLDVMLTSPAGSTFFEVTAGTKPADRPEFFEKLRVLEDEELRTKALPTISMKDFLQGDKLARQAVFTRFGAGLLPKAGVPVPKGLNDVQTKAWSHGAATVMKELKITEPSEVLAELNGWMRRAKLAAGREITAHEATIKETEERISVQAAGAELIPQLEVQFKAALAFENLSTTRASLDRAKAELASFEKRAEDFLAAQPAHDAKIAGFESSIRLLEEEIKAVEALALTNKAELDAVEPRLRRVQALDSILETMIAQNVHTCPLCTTPGQDPAKLRATVTQPLIQDRSTAHTALTTARQNLSNRITASKANIDSAQRQIAFLNNSRLSERATLKTEAGRVQTEVATLEAALAASGNAYTGPTSAEIKAQIESYRTADAQRASVEALRETVRAKKTEQETAKRLEKEAEEMLQSLLQKVAGTAEASVAKYMATGFVAKLDLSGGGCEWRVVGADGRVHNKHTMSGAEKACLLVALALAWTEGAPLRVLLLDDADVGPFHSSPSNLLALLTKLKEAVDTGLLTQVFVAGIRPDEVPQGWTVIQR